MKRKNSNIRGWAMRDRLERNRKIDPITGCWLWTATLKPNGYGQIMVDRECKYVHRESYKEYIGKPKNLVLHIRTYPNKHCFNPEHLYDGSKSDNAIDLSHVRMEREKKERG